MSFNVYCNPEGTKAVRLEPLHTDHLAHVMGWVNDPTVMGYFASHQTEITEEAELAYMKSLISSRNDFVWSVFDELTGEYVGQCSINAIHWPASNGRVFLVVTKEQQGKGYAGAILKALLHEGFFKIALHKLWLIVREDNLSSQKKYLKVGFEVEGLLKDEYFVQGKYHNMVRMGMINPEFSYP